MQWDMGLRGVGLLLALSLGAGMAAQIVAFRVSRRMWVITSVTVFATGLLVSEFWFGWATEKDLQPNIDGLSFDEVLIFGVMAAVASVLVTRFVVHRRSGRQRRGPRTGR